MPQMTEQIKRHLTANSYISKKDIIIGNFIGGVAWGFGTVIGATIIAALLIGILRTFGVFDGLTEFFKEINYLNQQLRPTSI